MGFRQDLEYGIKQEERATKLFNYKVLEYAPRDKAFASYDFKIEDETGQEMRVEVKSDRYTAKTGNICIEYENAKGASKWLADATTLVYFVEGESNCYVVPISELKDCIDKKLYHSNRNLGDGWRSKCYLFKREVFEKYQRIVE